MKGTYFNACFEHNDAYRVIRQNLFSFWSWNNYIFHSFYCKIFSKERAL